MKNLNHLFTYAGSLFVGFIKGREARSQWISKMKKRQDRKKTKFDTTSEQVHLDDFEMASFHKN